MTEHTPLTMAQGQEIISGIAVIKREIQYVADESKSQRNAIEGINARLINVENERRTEKGIIDGRKQMAFWIWSGVTVVAGAIGGAIALAFEAWIHVGHPI
jgi:hypothetical protein